MAVVPLRRVYGIGVLQGGLNTAWRLVAWGRQHSVETVVQGVEGNEEEDEEESWVKSETESIRNLSEDAEGRLQGVCCRRGGAICSDVSLERLSAGRLGSRSISYGELVHLRDERYSGVLNHYANRVRLVF